jgi:hypothetical protein
MQSWRDAWRALCDEIDVSAPAELLALAHAMHEVFVYFELEKHAYAMITPDEAREQRRFIASVAHLDPRIEPFTRMLPVFGQDGDYLLLDEKGRVHRWVHDDDPAPLPVCESLPELLTRVTPAAINPRHTS